jgi:cytochrome P450
MRSAPSKNHRQPPGPRGLPFFGVSFQIIKDPLGLMQRMARDYGDIVSFPVLGNQNRILLNNPEWIQQVLVIQHSKFHKSDFTKRAVERILGQGLLISEGDFWRRQRRLAQPAFQRARTNEYASTMVEIAHAHAAAWRDGDTRDVAHEMMSLTLDVAVRTLFGTTVPGEAERIGYALTYLMRYSLRRLRAPIRIPPNWPTPRNRRAQRDLDFLDSVVYRIINERKSLGDAADHDDLLSLLMGAMDEDGSQMTPRQLRDETMTLFLAGHETTALTLAWGLYLLSQNPAARSRLEEESRGVLAGRSPELADLHRLPYLQAVVNEILRLYPPAYISARTSIEPCDLGGYDFPAGTTFLMAQWVTHRDARFFDEPESFRPERWLDGLMDRLPPGAYFPFGGGPRRCIGQNFALLEACLVLAELAQRFRFELVPGQQIVPEPLVTLRVRHGIRMTLHARS